MDFAEFLNVVEIIAHSLLAFGRGIVSFFSMTLGEFYNIYIAPWFGIYSSSVQVFFDITTIDDYSLISLMLGAGVFLILGFSLIKWVIDILP